MRRRRFVFREGREVVSLDSYFVPSTGQLPRGDRIFYKSVNTRESDNLVEVKFGRKRFCLGRREANSEPRKFPEGKQRLLFCGFPKVACLEGPKS